MHLRLPRPLLALLGALILATIASASTAGNTVPGSVAGEGAGAVSGYAVTGVSYTLDAGNPANITAVTFSLDSAAQTVEAALGAAAYVSCTAAAIPGTGPWTCPVTGGVLGATSLKVLAAQ